MKHSRQGTRYALRHRRLTGRALPEEDPQQARISQTTILRHAPARRTARPAAKVAGQATRQKTAHFPLPPAEIIRIQHYLIMTYPELAHALEPEVAEVDDDATRKTVDCSLTRVEAQARTHRCGRLRRKTPPA